MQHEKVGFIISDRCSCTGRAGLRGELGPTDDDGPEFKRPDEQDAAGSRCVVNLSYKCSHYDRMLMRDLRQEHVVKSTNMYLCVGSRYQSEENIEGL